MSFHYFNHKSDLPDDKASKGNGVFPASRMVQYHGFWLSRALRSHRRTPRIPVRKVDEGGFAYLLTHPDGRNRAEKWWDLALEKVPV